MKIIIAKEIPAIIFITISLCVLMYVVAQKIKKINYLETPKGISFLAVLFVQTIDKFVGQNMDKEDVELFSPYIATIALYIFCANISGLSGFLFPPTASLSVTFPLAFITWFLIEKQSLKTNGIKGFIKNLFEPLPIFVLPNVLGHISPLISLSVRLFGNILSGGVILTIVYWATSNLSKFMFNLLQFNINFNVFGIFIAPILHLYFDIFAGFIQTFVFVSLTMVLIQKEK